MPFARPTLSALIEAAVADMASRFPDADPAVRRSNLNVLAKVQAGGLHGVYGYIDWLALQLMIDTAEGEWLDRHAAIWLEVPRKAAAAAEGNVGWTGSNGSPIPAGTRVRNAAGTEYETLSLATIAAGSATTPVRAVAGGDDGNLASDATVTLITPVAGIDGTATVASGGLTGGADTESDDLLRERLRDRIQRPPHGGSANDYKQWALEIAGVTRVWVAEDEQGDGTVVVRFVMDGKDATIIPDANEIQTVADHLDPLRPVTADLFVVAPVEVAFDVTITGLLPSTQAVKDAVTAQLADLLARESEPGVTILISHVREAVSLAAGETDHSVTVPAGDVAHNPGEMPVLGTVTFA